MTAALRLFSLASLLGALTTGAQASVLYNNMNTNLPLQLYSVANDGELLASLTSPNPNSTMTELQLLVNANRDAGVFQITVYDDFGGSPSSPLASGLFTDNSIAAMPLDTNGWAHFDTAAFVPLQDMDCNCGDSTFWIGVKDAGGPETTSLAWANDGNDSYPNESNVVDTNDPQQNLNADTNSFVMCVAVDGASCAAAPAPEPATLTLLGFGLAGLGLARRRRID
jgi:PEP-CTERM motif